MSKTKQTIELRRSEFAEEFLYLKGAPFSLDHYPFLRTVYDRPLEKDLVLKFSRQTSKSTTVANFMLIDSAMISHLHSLYVSPTSDQTKIFSTFVCYLCICNERFCV